MWTRRRPQSWPLARRQPSRPLRPRSRGRVTSPDGAGSIRVPAATDGPKGYTVKGNEDSMLYHTPESPSYKQTLAEVWFRDVDSAERAGFSRWDVGEKAAGMAGLVAAGGAAAAAGAAATTAKIPRSGGTSPMVRGPCGWRRRPMGGRVTRSRATRTRCSTTRRKARRTSRRSPRCGSRMSPRPSAPRFTRWDKGRADGRRVRRSSPICRPARTVPARRSPAADGSGPRGLDGEGQRGFDALPLVGESCIRRDRSRRCGSAMRRPPRRRPSPAGTAASRSADRTRACPANPGPNVRLTARNSCRNFGR